MKHIDIEKGSLVLYKNKVEVTLSEETIWLNLNQMAEIFERDKSVISRHLHNIFKNNELERMSVVAKNATTASDGKIYKVEYFNLDAIISVGYRVNSKKGTQFRIWATNVLRKHLVDGYTINEKRLKIAQHKFQELQKSVKLLENVSHIDSVPNEAKGLIQVLSEYTRALDILDDCDHEKLSVPRGTTKAKFELTSEEAYRIIEAMKKKFKSSGLMAQEKDNSFKSSIGAIYQTFGKKDVYPTVEEKAAHLLYFVAKNHSFVDGNKRIAAALFVTFLQKNGILTRKDGERRVDNNALVALTLMVAASKPSEKDMLIKIILNLLK